MIIKRTTFTEEALAHIEQGESYDKEWLAKDVAASLAQKLYMELGGVNAMSMADVDHLREAFFSASKSLIDWTRCNRKAHPEEYADLTREAWPKPIGGEL